MAVNGNIRRDVNGALDRRSILRGALALGVAGAAGSLMPRKVFAQPLTIDAQGLRILEVAQREVARMGDYLWQRDIVGIADFGIHSSQPRFHLANLENGTVRSFLVSHGIGSDPEHDGWLNAFSNVPGSHATSRGAYVTQEWYYGKYGLSLRLGGLEPSNSHAYNRAIVMHSADYAAEDHVARWGRLGRSKGCFAMGPENFYEGLSHLYGGRLLFADRLGFGADEQQAAPPVDLAPENPGPIT